MEASQRVEFFFSPGSRYSYLAASQMALLEEETGCTVDWRPVNGGDIRKLRRRDPFEGEPVSGQYDWSYRERDARFWADYYGIRLREPRRAITSISGSSPEPLRQPSGLAEPRITAGGYAQRSTERILGRSMRQSVSRWQKRSASLPICFGRHLRIQKPSESLPRPRKRLSVAARLECRRSLSVGRCSGATTGSRS
jgi:hypothetical protein